MKVLYLALLSLATLLPTAVRAQETTPALREQATAATRTLAAFIALDDARQLPVRRLVQLRLTQEQEARAQYANDPTTLRNKLTVIGRDYTTQLSNILSPAQFERLLNAAPNALPATVAAVQAAIEPAPSAAPATTPAPAAANATVARVRAVAPGRAATKPLPRAPVRSVAPAGRTIRH